MKKIILSVKLLVFAIFNFCNSCMINDTTEGRCVTADSIIEEINFCKGYIPKNICIPFKSV